jgi:hypothetical protein
MAKRGSNKVVTVTSRGSFAPALTRSRIPVANLGRFDPATGRVYQRPRQKIDYVSGSSVRVTNPAYAGGRQEQRTASIGMNAAGQKMRNS